MPDPAAESKAALAHSCFLLHIAVIAATILDHSRYHGNYVVLLRIV